MNELDLYKAFFHRWEELHLLPKKPGAPSKEHKEAAERLVAAAHEIRGYVAPQAREASAPVDPGIAALRQLQGQVAQIPPRVGNVKALT